MIDPVKAKSKWSPICNILQIEDDKMREYVSCYAEHHSKIESKSSPLSVSYYEKNSSRDIDSNLLPVSMKLLSKINFENKHFLIVDPSSTDTYSASVSIDISENNTKDNPRWGMDLVQSKESELVDKMADIINEKLKEFNTLVVYSMISSIKVSVVGMTLESRIGFKK